jgi:hypothetical protein
MGKNQRTGKPEVTGNYHEVIDLVGVGGGTCDLCRFKVRVMGSLKIPDNAGGILRLNACPTCLLELAGDITRTAIVRPVQ